MTRIAILGTGRMGQQLVAAVNRHSSFEIVGIWSRRKTESDKDARISCDLHQVLQAADVAIDFTLPAACDEIVDAVIKRRIPLVSGVSGLTADQANRLRQAAESIAVLHERNMSVGIALLTRLVELAGRSLGTEFAAEIHETHHVHKIDAPSGTALALGESLARGRGQPFEDVYEFAPDGSNTAPSGGAIRFYSERRGEVPGDHKLILQGIGETLILGHSVADRSVFAEGALKAARFLVGKRRGFYRMSDVLGSQAESAGTSMPA